MKNTIATIVFLILAFNAYSQKHWEAIVSGTGTWSYLVATSAPPSNWNQIDFDDSQWKTGKGGFGYSDGDDSTIISACNSIYLRKIFTIDNISILNHLLLDIDYDDAFVLYINGKEVARSSNLNDSVPMYNSSLTKDHEARLYQGLTAERFNLNLSDLVQGTNIVALQVINYSISSSDMSALAYLSSEINSSSLEYENLPSWFEAPLETNLPLIFINTQGQAIVDEPKITAKMQVINNASGINSVIDSVFEYNGYIGIELHGASSLSFDKKSYAVETRDSIGDNLSVSLLGLPAENDWILYGPYSDKTMIRNVLAYAMGNMTGRWNPHTRYCEVFVNNEYRGVYVLVEKIKVDKNRVNLSKLKSTDISGNDLTGGYILRFDRTDYGSYWISPYKDRSNNHSIYINYYYPKADDLTNEQKTYIKNYITNFENTINSTDFTDTQLGYRPYVDIISFVDFYIVNEISKNIDGYRLSSYFYKNKDSKNNKIFMGPLWDYNIAFGNADYYSGGITSNWVADGVSTGDDLAIPFWWDKFRLDPYFNAELRNRWDEMRTSKYSNENLFHIIDSCATLLSNAQKRNYEKFNTLNTYVWPNYYVGGTYNNEVTYLKTWLSSRLDWMDSQIKLINGLVNIKNSESGVSDAFTYPNPFDEYVKFNFTLGQSSQVSIQILDLTGEILFKKSGFYYEGINEITVSSNEFFATSGIYLYKIYVDNKIALTGKLLRK